MKRGQTTLFIVLGLILVILIGLAFYLSIDNNIDFFSQSTESSESVQELEEYVQNCFDSALFDAVWATQDMMAYDFDLSYSNYFVPIYFEYNRQIEVDSGLLSEQMENYIANDLYFCINGFLIDYENLSLEINQISVDVDFQNIVYGSLNFDAVLDSEELAFYPENDYSSEVSYEILKMFELNSLIVQDHINNHGETCIQCFIDYGKEYNVTFSSWYSDDIVHYEIIDESFVYEGNSYGFLMGVEDFE